jgi:excisionase family DNA binding protein
MQSRSTATLPQRPLSVAEAAEFYGVSVNSIHAWIKRGHLKSFKKGRRRFIPASELLPREVAE